MVGCFGASFSPPSLEFDILACFEMAEVDVASVASGLGSEHAELPRNVEREPLIQQLDELLERYLHTLDEYEKVSKELSEQLSSVTHPTSYDDYTS